MTDNDKAARDVRRDQNADTRSHDWKAYIRKKRMTRLPNATIYKDLVRYSDGWDDGFDAALAHAEAMHAERVKAAIEVAIRYGGIDGSHHKMWVIDQMLRVLCGDTYKDVIREACTDKDGYIAYDWDTGIAP